MRNVDRRTFIAKRFSNRSAFSVSSRDYSSHSDNRSQQPDPASLRFCSGFAITLLRMVKGSLARRSRRPSLSDRTVRRFAALGSRAAIIVLLASFTAIAAPPQNADPALAPWFRSLINPVVGLSCCAESDGHILKESEWRVNGNQYEIHVAGNWWPVPPQNVLNNVPNPTGGAVAFWEMHRHGNDRPPNIYCFVRPVES